MEMRCVNNKQQERWHLPCIREFGLYFHSCFTPRKRCIPQTPSRPLCRMVGCNCCQHRGCGDDDDLCRPIYCD